MYNHLTLTDRCMIEKYLSFGYNVTEIADRINRSQTTVSREIRKHRIFVSDPRGRCAKFRECKRRNICGTNKCGMKACKSCKDHSCKEKCDQFEGIHCSELDKPPYVCADCDRYELCTLEHAYYHAHKAHNAYMETLSDSRKHLHVADEDLSKINDLVSPLVLKGQSLNHIFATHSEEIGVSRKTLYNYIDKAALDVRNIDLPRKVRYKKRKSKQSKPIEYKYRKGRTYADFKSFIENNPQLRVVEMDTVKGRREKGKCLLTMIFVEYELMLIFLLDSCSQDCVEKTFDSLTKVLTLVAFRRMFPLILTDNGSEFKDPESLEFSAFGKTRTRIFYCDPMASYQKAHIERNHEFIRQILPKGVSFDDLTQEDVTLMMNHINSVKRDSLDGLSPYEAADPFIPIKLVEALGLEQIPPDEILLKPELLR